MTPAISVNGRRIFSSDLAISPLDRGFTLGDGIFETLRVEHGMVWYLDRHLDRLERATQYTGIPHPAPIRQWIADLLATPEVTAAPLLVLRVTVTRGVAHTHGLAADTNHTTTVITATPIAPFPESIYTAGLNVSIASARLNERAYTAGFKTTSYAESILAIREANAKGYDDTLFLNTRNFVAETSSSNIFAWLGDTLITPSLESGIFPGITRTVVLESCVKEHIVTEERLVALDELIGSDEAFCTSSIRGIVPIIAIDNTPIGTGVPGLRTSRLMAWYATQIRRL